MSINHCFLGTKNVHKLLVALATPAVIAMLASGIYSFLSTLMIAKGISIQAVGAVGIVFPIQILFHGFAQMISIGAASDISRNLGKQADERAHQTTTYSYILTLAISIGLMIAFALLTKPILLIFGSNEELLALSQDYLTVLLWSIPFNAVVLLSSAIFRAEGNLKLSMYIVLLESILNLILEFIVIYYLKWGVRGVAIAIIISQAMTALYALSYILRQKSIVRIKKEYLRLNLEDTKAILTVGFSAFARNGATAGLSLSVNTTISCLGGTNALTAFGTVNRIVNFFFLPIMGVNQGMQPIASYNYGAQKFERIKLVVKYSLLYTTAIGLIATLTGILYPKTIIQLFINQTDILNEATLIFRLQLLFFWSVGLQTVTATLYQALGQALPALFISVFKQLLILIPLVYILSQYTSLELDGVWYAFPISEIIAFIITLIILQKKWRTLNEGI